MTAHEIVDKLLEMSETPMNPVVAKLHHNWVQGRRFSPWEHPDPIGVRVRGLMRDTDASGRSMEGEPSEDERKREQAIAAHRRNPDSGGYPRKSHTIASNRNARRKGFGYRDVYSTRDRNWPMPSRKSYYKTADRVAKLRRMRDKYDEGSGI